MSMLGIAVIMFFISTIGTMSYASRIAGIQTRHLMFTAALYNIPIFFIRMAQTLLLPILTKRVEASSGNDIEMEIRVVLLASSIGTIVGAFGIPVTNRLLSAISVRAETMADGGGWLQSFRKWNWRSIRSKFSLPHPERFRDIFRYRNLPWFILGTTFLGIFMFSSGLLSACYAAYLIPEYRATAISLAPMMNGISTAIMFTVVDPQIGLWTDRAVQGKISEAEFKRITVWIVIARLAATLSAQVTLVPMAWGVVWLARNI